MTPEELIRELCKVLGLDVEGCRVEFAPGCRPYVEALAKGAGGLSARPAGPPRYIEERWWMGARCYLVEGLPRSVVVTKWKWYVLFDCVRPSNAAMYFPNGPLELFLLRVELQCWDVFVVFANIDRSRHVIDVDYKIARTSAPIEELPLCMVAAEMLCYP